jgi:nicotinamidase-related amidase
MTSPARTLDRERAALVVIDVQDGFEKAVPQFGEIAEQTAILVQGARILGLPVVVTEQYPRGLGETTATVREALDGAPRLPKTVFSAAQADGFDLAGRDQALVCGIEAHICVSQTAHDLLGQGVEVHVASDAVCSRSQSSQPWSAPGASSRLVAARMIAARAWIPEDSIAAAETP